MCTRKPILLLVVLITAGLAACGRAAPQPTELIGGLLSYTSSDEISLMLSSEGREIGIESFGSPDEVLISMDVPYTHLGVSGKLSLSFFNNQLMSAVFYPDESEDYLVKLKTIGVDFSGSDEITLPPNTLVRKNKDYKGQFYVAWDDRVLTGEFQHFVD
jgi:hypothetical protein